ncbi:MAG: tetratricopeptide repeat protein, partial [Bacteroidales bacterium]|nr:tetratricopeptide repeat protein [Bacteroidales bacterium]
MKTSIVCKHYILLVILAIGIQCPLLAQNPEALFQQGLIKEEGEGSLQEAIDIYIKVASDESVERPLQANALLHMGLCYEKLGRTEARKTYQYIIQNYPDQTETVKVAREKLALLSQSESGSSKEAKDLHIRKVWEVP